MNQHKQQLLKEHRRQKRLRSAVVLTLVILAAYWLPWWSAPFMLIALWVAHEAWFSDHLFYSPRADYRYCLAGQWEKQLLLEKGVAFAPSDLPEAHTFVVEIQITATLAGYFVDPYIVINTERFDFERGARGRRFIVLADALPALRGGACRIDCHHCRVASPIKLTGFAHPDYSSKRLLIIAPHADDAELAAFGLYSQARDVMIATLTQGEIEAEHYLALGLDEAEAATLKGRLRSWDSIATPLWGKVPIERCVQLGYYCMQLSPMENDPDRPFGSKVSEHGDTREVRGWNRVTLPSDRDGKPTWNNLIADLAALLRHFRPEVIVMPHPQRDPHPDHVAATNAVAQAARTSGHQPEAFLLYTNHLHDNDRWPMGPAGGGVGLPPSFSERSGESFWMYPTPRAAQLDKAMALAMQHDLRPRPPFKKRIRRQIQKVLAGRRWPPTGENEFFRKAVRSCEIFQTTGSLPHEEACDLPRSASPVARPD